MREGRELSKNTTWEPQLWIQSIGCTMGVHGCTMNGQWSLSRESLSQGSFCWAGISMLSPLPFGHWHHPFCCSLAPSCCTSAFPFWLPIPICLFSFISLCPSIWKLSGYLPSWYLSFYCCVDCSGFGRSVFFPLSTLTHLKERKGFPESFWECCYEFSTL